MMPADGYMTLVNEFRAALVEAGLIPGDTIPDGQIRRCGTHDHPTSKNGWYVLYPKAYAGAFGDWADGTSHKWSMDKNPLSPVDRNRLQKEIKRQRAEREAVEAQRRQKAVAKAREYLGSLPRATADIPYLVTKGVKPIPGLLVDGNDLLVPILSPEDNKPMSYQRIDPVGNKRFMKGGRTAGGYLVLKGKKDGDLIIAEGIATALSTHWATGLTVIVAFSARNLLAVAKMTRARYPSRSIIVAADNDKKTEARMGENPGVKYATEASHAIKAKVAIPEQSGDWNDVHVAHGLDAVRAGIEAAKHNDSTPPPIDIFGDLSICGSPEWPEDACPRVIDEFARDNAERLGVTVGMVAISAIVVAAASITDDYKLQPKQLDTEWVESPRLWAAIVAEPSAKKSPAIDAAMRPLKKLEAKWFNEDSILLDLYEDALRDYERSKTNTDKPKRPRLRRKSVNDFTIESLVDILKDNPEGILCFRDELTGWITSLGAYKQNSGGDRATMLEAYNGGPRLIDRVKKGRDYVPNWSLSILGGIQPGPLRRTIGKISDDGLVQRIIMTFGRREGPGVDRRPNYQAIGAYDDLIVRLNALRPHKADRPMRLSAGAQEQRAVVQSIVNDLLVLPDTTERFKQHLNKWDGLFARLTLTYHIIEHAHLDIIPIDVSGETASKVARMMLDFLLPNAARFYVEILGADDQLVGARWVAGYILSRKLERITFRDIYRSYRRLRNDHQGIFKTLQALQTAGWVSPIDKSTKPFPQKWTVDNRVHDLFAERAKSELERREREKADVQRAVKNLSLHKRSIE